MNFPQTIPFGAVEITIRSVHSDDLDNDMGDYSIRDGKPVVRFDRDLQGGLKDTTILHELTHAWIKLSSINLEDDVEETLCDAIAQGVAQMIGTL